MLLVVVVGGGLHLDGIGPHVDEAGGGGAAWDGGHPSTSIHIFTSPVHPQPSQLGGKAVSSDPILHGEKKPNLSSSC